MKKATFFAAVGIAVAILGLAVTMFVSQVALARHRLSVRASVLQQLGTARAAVERSLNERIYLTLGLRAYVATNPDINSEQFATYAAALMREGDGLRSVTLIKDNVITDVYPRKGNESAIGTQLLENPQQREGVLQAIQSREPWLSVPIRLVQGGEAFINRAPVYETPLGGDPGSGRYWGLVSILISKEVLLNDILQGLPEDLNLAIRANAPDGETQHYVYGDASIESHDPIRLHVNLPTGDWEVAGTPMGNWPQSSPAATKLWWLGSVVSIAMGFLSAMLLKSNVDYRTARATAESAVVQLSRKNEDLEAFIGSASHDLRTPMRHIRDYCEMIIEDASERLIDEDIHRIGRIHTSSDRATQLLSSLLRFAETGASGIEPESFSMQAAADVVLEQMREANAQCVEVAELPNVVGDRLLLTQVLQNLIENALKYNNAEAPRVIVSSSSTSTDTTISIADNGIGMKPSQLERIFKPGIRGVASSDYTGTGFGLAICERIVKAHGGKIWVESQEGTGSTFHFTLSIGPNGNASSTQSS